MKGYRQAAVALHALDGDDRTWVLEQLAPSPRAMLGELMHELDELGFGTAPAPASTHACADDTSCTPQERLARAGVEAVMATLEREPVALVAQLVNAQDWPWSEALLAALPAARRGAVREALVSVAVAPARDRFLVEQVVARLASHALTGPSVAALPAPRAPIIERVRRWIR